MAIVHILLSWSCKMTINASVLKNLVRKSQGPKMWYDHLMSQGYIWSKLDTYEDPTCPYYEFSQYVSGAETVHNTW